MAKYVDGFVLPIPKKNVAAYKKMANMGRKAWMKAGALSYYECILEDAKHPMVVPFTKLAKAKPNETVIFAYIEFKSKAHRNRVNKAVHKHFSEMGEMGMAMPFDMKRMSYGGFKAIVHS